VQKERDFEKKKPVRKPACCGCGSDKVPIGANRKDWCSGCWPAKLNGQEAVKK
jgi:hypothetical protein